MRLEEAIRQMNAYGKEGRPFLFLMDFNLKDPNVWPVDAVDPAVLTYQLAYLSSPAQPKDAATKTPAPAGLLHVREPFPLAAYTDQFNQVMAAVQRGDTYLVNLTCQTPVTLTTTLEDVYERAHAKYKLKYKDHFVCFSPETFVRIKDGCLSTCPMKGTIDATLPDAAALLLANVKEKAEHSTVVDLLRNDVSRVATEVKVERFRYVEEVLTDRGRLLQVSSLITGVLPPDYPAHIGDILVSLLPAGSVTGAPKARTVDLINAVETYERGYWKDTCGGSSRPGSSILAIRSMPLLFFGR